MGSAKTVLKTHTHIPLQTPSNLNPPAHATRAHATHAQIQGGMGSAKTVLTSGVKLVQGDLLAFSTANATVVWLASLCFSEAFMHKVCITYTNVHIDIFTLVYTCTYTYTYTCVYRYTGVFVYMHVYVNKVTYMHIYIYIYMNVNTKTICIYIHT